MNARERFNAIMNFDTSVRTLKWEFGYWAENMKKVVRRGLKPGEVASDVKMQCWGGSDSGR